MDGMVWDLGMLQRHLGKCPLPCAIRHEAASTKQPPGSQVVANLSPANTHPAAVMFHHLAGPEAWEALWGRIQRSTALIAAAALKEVRADHAALNVPPESTFEVRFAPRLGCRGA
jgi:hypothetical protein